MFHHRKCLVVGLPALLTALLAGHWIPVWLIGVAAVIALPLWLAAAWYMACVARLVNLRIGLPVAGRRDPDPSSHSPRRSIPSRTNLAGS